MKIDPKKIGLKFGIEIHQRLKSHKLFCKCSSELDETEPYFKFNRKLRAIFGELGEVDPAAMFEYMRGRKFLYNCFDDETCAVEMDEEPPHLLNKNAFEIGIQVALMLNAKIPDEMFVMRKTVIDGSNTSGFQRTMVIGLDGALKHKKARIPILSVCLEEESAGIIEGGAEEVKYSLDRLGIPLVEIATGIMEGDPELAREVAEKLGMLLRSTGKVMRGIGTIRQDLNVSVKDGRRIEIKGVQALDLIPTYIENEALRQVALIGIMKEFKKRKIKLGNWKFLDITDVFKNTQSKLVRGKMDTGARVIGMKVPGFSGLLKTKLFEGRTFGKELADVAAVEAGVKGIIHTDELPSYGITEDEINQLKRKMGAGKNDAVIFLLADKLIGLRALEAISKRIEKVPEGVLKETRKALPDGRTGYMRPLPGAARMYPETDVPPMGISKFELDRIKKNLPETPEASIKKLIRSGVSKSIADEIYSSGLTELFNKSIKIVPAQLVASVLVETSTWLRRENVDVDKIPDEKYIELFRLLKEGKVAKEAVPDILIELAAQPQLNVKDAAGKLGIKKITKASLEKVVDKILKNKKEFVQSEGERALGGLMGLVMEEVKGKIDGKVVNEVLKKKLKKMLR